MSHEVDHEGTPTSSHISMSDYRTITWKATYKATPRTDWRVVALSMKPSNWNQQYVPRHARYFPVYGWHHEPNRNWYINSDNLHKGTSPWAGNRWWQYQVNSSTIHDLWAISTISFDQCLHWWYRNECQSGQWGWYCQWHPYQQHRSSQCTNTKTLHQIQSRVRGMDDGHLSCWGLTIEEHHGCISHWCVLSSTNPDQEQIAISSKISATTKQ